MLRTVLGEGSVGAIPNSPQRLKSFSKRGETLKMLFPAKFCEANAIAIAWSWEKDFWLSVLAGRRQSQEK
jgi:hypothetical protein